MILLNPKQETFNHLDEKSKEIMQQTIGYFESRGKKKLKKDYNDRIWYEDFLSFLKENKIFSTLLTPSKHSKDNPDARWDTFRRWEIRCRWWQILYWQCK